VKDLRERPPDAKRDRLGRIRTVFRYDRKDALRCIREEGYQEALKHYPYDIVRPLAHVHGLLPKRDPRTIWRGEWSPLLGTMPDCDLAVKLGVSHALVSRYRKIAGRPPYSGLSVRRAAREAILARISDEDLRNTGLYTLADRHRINFVYVAAERKRRGVKYQRPTKDLDERQLRKVAIAAMVRKGATYAQIGRILNVSRERVRQIAEMERVIHRIALPHSRTGATQRRAA